jgi:MarR family transcriptional regulator, organic hydroperoxide resistance regulator
MADPVRRLQRAYPQLYLACHVDHTTRRRDHGLSDRDSSVLAHLDELAPVGAGVLARHLGVGPSTVTEAIDRLAAKGLVERRRRGRRVELRLTRAGVDQMQASSVLDADRVAALIAAVPARQRAAALRGLELLADAARRVMTGSRRRA